MRKLFSLLMTAAVAVVVAGCSQQKDYSQTPLEPKGEPPPDAPVAAPAGAGGPAGASQGR